MALPNLADVTCRYCPQTWPAGDGGIAQAALVAPGIAAHLREQHAAEPGALQLAGRIDVLGAEAALLVLSATPPAG